LPGKTDWHNFTASLADRIAQRIAFLRRRMSRRTVDAVGRLAPKPGKTLTVLSLCRGNICRSPYAALRLAEKARTLGVPLRIIDAGTQPRVGRESPETARHVAAERGLDLSSHRSTHVTSYDLGDVDCILHFDPVIEMELRQLCPSLPPAVLNLAHLIPPPASHEAILDPIDRPAEDFRRVYGQIDAAIDGFLGLLGDPVSKRS
jgi:protein-tyrosine-phosphatase